MTTSDRIKCINKVNELINEVIEECGASAHTALMYLRNTKSITNEEYKNYLNYLTINN